MGGAAADCVPARSNRVAFFAILVSRFFFRHAGRRGQGRQGRSRRSTAPLEPLQTMAVRIRIRRQGWYYLAVVSLIFAGALFRQVNLLLILSGMIMSPLVLGWLLAWRTIGRLAVRRLPPGQAMAGEPLSISYVVSNPRKRLGAWAVVCEDSAVRENEPSAAEPLRVLFPHIAAGGQCKGVVRGALVRRGLYRFGPLRLSTRFPFGLFEAQRLFAEPQSILVLPRLGRLNPAWTARRRAALAGAHQRAARRGSDGDFFGLREWNRGDGLRRVAWRAAAKRGSPVVRDLEQSHSRDAALLVDLSQPGGPRAESEVLVERAVSCAATMAADLCRRGGGTLWLMTTDARFPPLGGATSGILLKDAMERLAVVESSPGDRSAALIEQAAAFVDADAEIILITTRPWTPDACGTTLRAGVARRLLVIDVSSEELRHYFDYQDVRPRTDLP